MEFFEQIRAGCPQFALFQRVVQQRIDLRPIGRDRRNASFALDDRKLSADRDDLRNLFLFQFEGGVLQFLLA